MNSKVALLFLVIVVAVFGTPMSWAQTADHIMVTPDEVVWSDVPSLPAGAKVVVIEGPLNEEVPFIIHLKLPTNYQIPAHWHPAIEHVTVITGTFNMGVGDTLDKSQSKALSAGSVAIMQPKINHFAWNEEETIIQVHGVGPWSINYVNLADDPRMK